VLPELPVERLPERNELGAGVSVAGRRRVFAPCVKVLLYESSDPADVVFIVSEEEARGDMQSEPPHLREQLELRTNLPF
jgi:hypothetical protein